MNKIKIIFYGLGFAFLSLFFEANAGISFSESTPIIFNDKNIRVFEDPTNSADYEKVLGQQDKFVTPNQIKFFKADVTYWIIQDIVNHFDHDKQIQIDASGWRELAAYVIHQDGKIQQLKSTGFEISNFNPYLTASPALTPVSKFESPFARFLIRKGEEVTVLSKVTFHPVFPAKSFSINFLDASSFSDFRRFGIYMEGLLLGTLFALMVFSLFNASQTKDKVNNYYALWITIAFFSVSSMNVIDGNRLFEFFFDIENLRAPWSDTYGYIIFVGFAFAQSISYILFARQYLGIKKFFPKIQLITNVFIAYALTYCFLALTGGFYNQNMIVASQWIAKTYSVVVGLILLTFFICSYLRYRDGFRSALFFTYAIVPYLIFRLSFLFGIIGVPTPFQYLPDQGIGYFLKNPFTNQAFGVCLEGLIMALAVISRARWLQEELTQSVNAQKELVEDQNRNLEATVATRTRELSEKHQLLENAHNTVLSSVNYASRLQRSQLPPKARLEGRFKSIEVLWEPRDTIGGDLWWVSSSQVKDRFSIAVADCTGHGVPGAMLSLLVSNSLERIYSSNPAISPSAALLSLDHLVRVGLNQDSPDSESDDGCDAAIISINQHEQILEYSGAKIDLFKITSNGEVHRYRSARISLGYQQPPDEEEAPTVQQIAWNDGDLFVMITDGYSDQIGGDSHAPRAFGLRKLEKMLNEFVGQSAAGVVTRMRDELSHWQGTQPRRDDVTAVVFSPAALR